MQRPPKPGPRRLERAGIVLIAMLVVVVAVVFFGRLIWHASEVDQPPPELQETRQP